MAVAGLVAVALLVTHIDQLGHDGDGQLSRGLCAELEPDGALHAIPIGLGDARVDDEVVHRRVLPRAPHHAHVVHPVLQRPDAAFRVEHMPAREHAHIVLGTRRHVGQLVEIAAMQHDALGLRESLLVQERRVVVDGHHMEAHVIGELCHLDRRIRRTEQPDTHLPEERLAGPGEAVELVVVHRRAAGNVLCLKGVARRKLTRGHDLLGVVAEEHERLAIGGTLLAVLLRDLIVHVALGGSCIVDDLEAEPSQIALIHGAQSALKRRNVGFGQRGGDGLQRLGTDMRIARRCLIRERREILHGQHRSASGLQVFNDGCYSFALHCFLQQKLFQIWSQNRVLGFWDNPICS